jgi:cation diffusion facilitator family transporter
VSNLYKENHRVLLLAVIAGTVLLIVKLIAAWLSNSTSILSDALESLVNLSAGLFGLYALHFANLPKDKNHPYGHGKIEFISAAFEGGLLFIAGLAIIGKAGYHVVFPQEIKDMKDGLVLVALAGGVNYLLGYALEKKGKTNNSIVLVAGGKHLKTDAYSSIALIAGALAVYLSGWVLLDNLIAIVFGVFLLYVGYSLLKSSFAGILDEADYDLIKELVELLDKERKENWIDVHNLRVIKYGSKLHVDCHITVPWYYSVMQGHDIVDELENVVRSINKDSVELFVHVDPCQPFSCSLCQLKECPERKHPFEGKIKWDLDLAMENSKHQIFEKK